MQTERLKEIFRDAPSRFDQNGHAVVAAGCRWFAATNGFAAVALKGAPDAHPCWDGAVARGLCDVIDSSANGDVRVSTTVEELRAFVGEPLFDSAKECEECDGTGEGKCGECGCACDCACDNCDDGKVITPPARRRVRIKGVKCDGNLVAKALIGASGTVVVVPKPDGDKFNAGRHVAIIGEDFVAVIMGMSDEKDDGSIAFWPTP